MLRAGTALLTLALGSAVAAAQLEELVARHFHIRVRLGDPAEVQRLEAVGRCVVLDRAEEIALRVAAGERLVVDCPEVAPAPPVWRVVVGEFAGHERSAAQALAARLSEAAHYPVDVIALGARGDEEPPEMLRVTLGQFASEEEAEAHRRGLGELAPRARLWHDDRGRPVGRLRLRTAEGEELGRFWERFTLLPAEEEALIGVRRGEETLRFRGRVVCQVDEEGRVQLINVVHVDDYLMGVVALEIGEGPPAAMQAQAIVARSEALHKANTSHHPSPDYDLCDGTHCMVYRGVGAETEAARLAVRETRGMVLLWEGEVCDAVYCHSCGGVTGSEADVWISEGTDYLVARLDTERAGPAPDLSSEAAVRAFLTDPPRVMCDPRGHNGLPDHEESNFRWRQRISAAELAEAAGADLGDIRGVEVTARGRSGRVLRLAIRGSEGTRVLEKTSAIRGALPDLRSSLFVVDEERDEQGRFTGAVFIGGGWGHGVGMCQVGATVRALAGQACREILGSYFPGAELRRVY